jgi:hypothetical protein
MVQTRWKLSSSGYLSQSDYRIHFGLGDFTQVDNIEIRWPNNQIQTLKNVKADQIITIKESIP